ncbi:ferredoxin [Desulfococcaceae bacterium HSG8]|nr:ferredoxin [Desulfococcaceae bacterium HSG8]
MKIPIVELSDCIQCGICEEVCPSVFNLTDLGYVNIAELSAYPESEVEEVIRNCPTDCICWEE